VPKSKKRTQAKKAGLRSGFELEVAEILKQKEVTFEYERESFEWLDNVPNAYCPACGAPAVAKRRYTPDFFLSNGIIIEAKGRFTPKDRKIALAMKAAERPVKMVFQFNNKLSRKSKTRYSEWCEKHGIDYAIRQIPEDWVKE
jgi:hypothetical protein